MNVVDCKMKTGRDTLMRLKNEKRHNEIGSEATRCIRLRQNDVSCGIFLETT
jgi:hypothetical protein